MDDANVSPEERKQSETFNELDPLLSEKGK
jgi:hypothetical protein